MKKLKLIGYWLIHATWGFPTFLFGVIVALVMLITGHRPYRFGYGVYFVTRKNSSWGFEAGPFFVISNDYKNNLYIKQHEHGHGIQTLWWGPLMFLVISIPSFIRFHYRNFRNNYHYQRYLSGFYTKEEYYLIKSKFPKYDDIWFEGQATKLGEKYFHQ